MQNKSANFWIRFLARAIDLTIVVALSYFVLYWMLEQTSSGFIFLQNWMFYIWALATIIFFVVFMIIFPLFILRNQTIGSFICRIKVYFKDSETKTSSYLKRELFFSLSWILLLALTMLIINHTLINMSANSNQSLIEYSPLEILRISIVSGFASIIFIFQALIGITIIVRPNKEGIHDLLSRTRIVWVNKFVEEPKLKDDLKSKKLKPILVKNNKVEWV